MKNKPDYKGFGERIQDWDKFGVLYNLNDLLELAEQYGTPIPGTKEWEGEFPQIEKNK